MDPFLVYAFRSSPPADVVSFRRLVGLDGRLGGITAICFLLYRPPGTSSAPQLRRDVRAGDGQEQAGDQTPERRDRGAEEEVSVWHFMNRTAPRLLPQLSRTIQPQRVQMHGRVRGRIDWEGTYKARYSEECNPTIFVCRQSGRRYDRPENQLLKYLLRRVQVCLEQVPADLKSWFVWAPAQQAGQQERVPVGRDLADLAHRLRTYQASAYLRDVDLPHAIGGHHLLAARTAKNPLYLELFRLYNLYAEVAEVAVWERWKLALNGAAPLPDDSVVSRLLLSTTYRSLEEMPHG